MRSRSQKRPDQLHALPKLVLALQLIASSEGYVELLPGATRGRLRRSRGRNPALGEGCSLPSPRLRVREPGIPGVSIPGVR